MLKISEIDVMFNYPAAQRLFSRCTTGLIASAVGVIPIFA